MNKRPLSGYQAPTRVPSESPIDYDAARIAWARGLSETDLRSLASDYLRGKHDEMYADAFREYERRFGEHDAKKKTLKGGVTGRSLRAKAKRKGK